jgi:hypothetical protein
VLGALVARTSFPDRAVHFAIFHPAAFFALAFVLSFELATLFADVRHLLLDAVHLGKMLIA